MSWMLPMTEKTYTESRLSKAYSELRERLSDNGFTFSDAASALKLSRRSVSELLKGLVAEKRIARTGRGVYTFIEKPAHTVSVEALTDPSRRLHSAFASRGLEFALSCLDILGDYTHLALRRFPHFCWVASGSEDWAMDIAEDVNLSPLREPDESHILLAMELSNASGLAIIRKTTVFYATTGGLASVERALVDLYYEVTRDRFPIDTAELMRIYYNTLTSISLEYPKMLRYAGLRRFRGEIEWILWRFRDHTDIPRTYFSKPIGSNKFTRRLPSLDESLL